MWTYLVDNKGSLNFDHNGRRIYINADRQPGDTEQDRSRDRAVRKMVRAVIEALGGDGRKLKEEGAVWANYQFGYVLCHGQRVAEWNVESKSMQILEPGRVYADAFRALMERS